MKLENMCPEHECRDLWDGSGMELCLEAADGMMDLQMAGPSPSWTATLTLARVKLRKRRALLGWMLQAGFSSWPVSGRLVVTYLGFNQCWTIGLRWFPPT